MKNNYITLLLVLITFYAKAQLNDWQHNNNNSKPIGLNLTEQKYYNKFPVYTNIMNLSQEWKSIKSTGWGASSSAIIPLNKNGYPAVNIPYNDGVNPESVLQAMVVIGNVYASGIYHLKYEGTGEIKIKNNGSTTFNVPNVHHPITIDSTASIALRITQSDASDPVRNIKLIVPGALSTYQAVPWHPRYLSLLNKERFSCIRTMSVQGINGAKLKDWSDRSTPDTYTQTKSIYGGLCYEHIVDLANITGIDIWINIPHTANSAYLDSLAHLLKNKLNSDRKVYVEWSNEVWNGVFQQYHDVKDTAVILGLDPSNPHRARGLYLALKSAETFRKFEDVLGDDKVINVIASQNTTEGNMIMDGFIDPAINTYGTYPEVYATAPYFGYRVPADLYSEFGVNVTVNQVLDSVEVNLFKALKRMEKGVKFGKSFGLPYIAYEGGQHISPPISIKNSPVNGYANYGALLADVNRQPGMKDLYCQYWEHWYNTNPGNLFVHFSYRGSYGGYGSWGMLEGNQDTISSYKWKSLNSCVFTDLPDYSVIEIGGVKFECGKTNNSFFVVVENQGHTDNSLIPLNVQVDGSSGVLNYTANLPNGLERYKRDTLWFNVDNQTGGAFNIKAVLAQPSNYLDSYLLNDTLIRNYNVLPEPQLTTVNDTVCNGDVAFLSTLSANIDSVIWYSDSGLSNIIGNGLNYTTQGLTANDSVYVQGFSGDYYHYNQLDVSKVNNGRANGFMFSVVAKANDIIIEKIAAYADASVTDTMQVYMKNGTYVGVQTTPSAWNLYAQLPVTTIVRQPFDIDVPDFNLNSLDTVSFYIHFKTSANKMRTKNGSNVVGGTSSDSFIDYIHGSSFYGVVFSGNPGNNARMPLRINYKYLFNPDNGCKTIVKKVKGIVSLPTTVSGIVALDTCQLGVGIATTLPTAGYAPYTYQWDANAGNQQTQNATALNSGFYNAVVTDKFGCFTNDGVVIPSIMPSAIAATSSSNVVVNQVVSFSSNGSNGNNYQWNFGDGSPLSNLQNPTHMFSTPGTFNVVLTVGYTNCSDSYTIAIVVNSTTAINEVDNGLDWNFYPNPVKDVLHINLLDQSKKNISIIDVNGKVLIEYIIISNEFKIDVNQLNTGVYFIRIEDETEHLSIKKFLKF